MVPADRSWSPSARTRRRFLDLDHGQVHYWECRSPGELDGPPLVMFHASPVSARSLLPLASALADQRPVFAVDLPGNGDSDPLGPPQPTIAQLADAMTDVTEHVAHEERLRAMAGVVALFVSIPADVLRSTTETAAAMVPGSEFVEVGDGDPDRPDRVAVIDGWLRRERGDRREPVTR